MVARAKMSMHAVHNFRQWLQSILSAQTSTEYTVLPLQKWEYIVQNRMPIDKCSKMATRGAYMQMITVKWSQHYNLISRYEIYEHLTKLRVKVSLYTAYTMHNKHYITETKVEQITNRYHFAHCQSLHRHQPLVQGAAVHTLLHGPVDLVVTPLRLRRLLYHATVTKSSWAFVWWLDASFSDQVTSELNVLSHKGEE